MTADPPPSGWLGKPPPALPAPPPLRRRRPRTRSWRSSTRTSASSPMPSPVRSPCWTVMTSTWSPRGRARWPCLAERLVQPLVPWLWATTLPLRLAERSPRPSLAAANGQFLVLTRAGYDRAGGTPPSVRTCSRTSPCCARSTVGRPGRARRRLPPRRLPDVRRVARVAGRLRQVALVGRRRTSGRECRRRRRPDRGLGAAARRCAARELACSAIVPRASRAGPRSRPGPVGAGGRMRSPIRCRSSSSTSSWPGPWPGPGAAASPGAGGACSRVGDLPAPARGLPATMSAASSSPEGRPAQAGRRPATGAARASAGCRAGARSRTGP